MQFLDEADLLADRLAILKAPGELCAEGTPVALKKKMGTGFLVRVTFSEKPPAEQEPKSSLLLSSMRTVCSEASLKSGSTVVHGRAIYELNTKSPVQAEQMLLLLERKKASGQIVDYSIHNSSLEDVFQSLITAKDVLQESTQGGTLSSRGEESYYRVPKSLILQTGRN